MLEERYPSQIAAAYDYDLLYRALVSTEEAVQQCQDGQPMPVVPAQGWLDTLSAKHPGHCLPPAAPTHQPQYGALRSLCRPKIAQSWHLLCLSALSAKQPAINNLPDPPQQQEQKHSSCRQNSLPRQHPHSCTLGPRLLASGRLRGPVGPGLLRAFPMCCSAPQLQQAT